jgi:iron-sulfur cluster assembly protein/iron-sulfur cluster insertion protein
MSEPTTAPIVRLSSRAAAEVRSRVATPENTGKTLRLYVEQGGCSGMQYGLVFDEPRAGDLSAEQDGVTVLVDAISAEFLRGTIVEFSEDLTAGGFKLINPNAKESCGCGKSFAT